MRFTPNHNWPVSEDTDVVKQYPATVDQPFKDALDPLVPLEVGPGTFFVMPNGLRYLFGSIVATTDSAGIIWHDISPFGFTTTPIGVGNDGGSPGTGYVVFSTDDSSLTAVKWIVYSAGGVPVAGWACRINYVLFG